MTAPQALAHFFPNEGPRRGREVNAILLRRLGDQVEQTFGHRLSAGVGTGFEDRQERVIFRAFVGQYASDETKAALGEGMLVRFSMSVEDALRLAAKHVEEHPEHLHQERAEWLHEMELDAR